MSIPDDFDVDSEARTTGVVTLHRGLWWSGDPLILDTSVEKDLIRLYEIVLTEGRDDDVREFISCSTLMRLWENLFLPRYVRRRWSEWFDSRIPEGASTTHRDANSPDCARHTHEAGFNCPSG